MPGFDARATNFTGEVARLPDGVAGRALRRSDYGMDRFYRIGIGVIGGQVGDSENQPKGNDMCNE